MPVYVYELLFAAIVVALLAGFGVAYLLLSNRQGNGVSALEAKAQQALSEAETQAKEKLLEAKEDAVKVRTAAEQEAREYRLQSKQIEKRLLQKEENLDRKGDDLNRREREFADREKGLDEIKAQLEDTYRQQEQELQRVANMTRQEAQGVLMAQVEQDLRNEVARKVRESELAARDESERRAREIVTESIQRIAADQTAEVSVSVLPLPTDELKGRIIGKEGRNIRALQQATGIDLIVDDTPEAVIISGFDPVRREVARVALNKLIVDGRIHPARIEEIVAKSRQEGLHRVKEEGEAAGLKGWKGWCWSRPTPSPRPARGRAGSRSRPTSSDSRSWRRSPIPSRAFSSLTPSRPDARCGSWSSPSRSTTQRLSSWRETSPNESKASSVSQVRSASPWCARPGLWNTQSESQRESQLGAPFLFA